MDLPSSKTRGWSGVVALHKKSLEGTFMLKKFALRKLALALLFVALGAVTAFAADVSGKWTASVQGRRGTQNITFNFTVDGSTLTGKITTDRGDSDISNGKVDGDTISFDQVMNFNGEQHTISYKGTVSGDSIKFTRSFGDRTGPEFTATRAAQQ
jgi:hypothetical protein